MHRIIRHYRRHRGETQEEFWSRFGVTQSNGSRLETNSFAVPAPVALLIVLFRSGRITALDLANAAEEIRKQKWNVVPKL